MSYITIKLRRGTAAQWTASNPILNEGEVGLETDTRKFKVGDGATQWSGLSYWNTGGGGGISNIVEDLTPQLGGDLDGNGKSISDVVNIEINGYQDFTEIAAPSNPDTSHARLYAFDNNGKTGLFFKGSDGIPIRIGRDMFVTVRNTTAGILTRGTLVYVTGATGNVPNVAAAQANSITTLPALGMLAEDIAVNGYGRCQSIGVTEYAVNTTGISAGTEVYVSGSSAGAFTATHPLHPNHPQAVGVVLVGNSASGSLYLNVDSHENGHGDGTTDETWTIGATAATSLKIAKSSTGSQKTATFPDKNGTVAFTSDLTNFFDKTADDTDDITVGTTNKFATAAEKTKLGHITVTQAVDLDTIESRVNALDAAVVLKGSWDASAGTFPGGGTAQAGDSYIVSVGGTVDSVVFTANDRIVAILDNASTTTYANNWLKLDYTDQVLSVAGKTGAVTLQKADITDFDAYVPGGTDVPITDGGTGASSAANARTNLGLAIGTDVQAYSAVLADLSTKWTAASASTAANLAFHEDTDNGTNKITLIAPAAIASDKTITFPDETGTVLTTASGVSKTSVPCEFIIACSDETTALTAGTAKVTFRAPYAFTVTAVRASVTTAPTGASLLTVDINESGVSILSTKLTIDASEKTSTTAATAAVISDSAIADDAEITIDIDQIGSTIAGAGLKVYIIGTHSV